MKNRGKELFDKLYEDTRLTETEYKELLELHTDKEMAEYGFELARKRQKETFGMTASIAASEEAIRMQNATA